MVDHKIAWCIAVALAGITGCDESSLPVPQDPRLIAGYKTWKKSCQACHQFGLNGAPKPLDRAAWTPRLAKGADTLKHNAVVGFGNMAPKGGFAKLANEDVYAAVDYIIYANTVELPAKP